MNSEQNKRESGFYRCNVGGAWTICRWDTGPDTWTVLGGRWFMRVFDDYNPFVEINETPINPEPSTDAPQSKPEESEQADKPCPKCRTLYPSNCHSMYCPMRKQANESDHKVDEIARARWQKAESLIKQIPVVRANFQHIAETGIINGSLLSDLTREIYHHLTAVEEIEALKASNAELVKALQNILKVCKSPTLSSHGLNHIEQAQELLNKHKA